MHIEHACGENFQKWFREVTENGTSGYNKQIGIWYCHTLFYKNYIIRFWILQFLKFLDFLLDIIPKWF